MSFVLLVSHVSYINSCSSYQQTDLVSSSPQLSTLQLRWATSIVSPPFVIAHSHCTYTFITTGTVLNTLVVYITTETFITTANLSENTRRQRSVQSTKLLLLITQTSAPNKNLQIQRNLDTAIIASLGQCSDRHNWVVHHHSEPVSIPSFSPYPPCIASFLHTSAAHQNQQEQQPR